MSSRHAELRWDGSRWLLRDLASSNGTRVGLHKVTRARAIESDEHLILGAVDLLFVEDRAPEPDPEPVLAALEADGRLTRTQVRSAQLEWAEQKGRLGEILVRNGWLSPGQWHEAATDSAVSPVPRPISRVWWLIALTLAGAVLAWALAARD